MGSAGTKASDGAEDEAVVIIAMHALVDRFCGSNYLRSEANRRTAASQLRMEDASETPLAVGSC